MRGYVSEHSCRFCPAGACAKTHGIVVANLDRSVKPGDDFYRFANGDWIKRTEIPPDRAAVDVFTKLADLSNKRTNDLINEIAKSNAAAGSGERKVADLFNSYMNESAIEAKGMAPLKPHLDAIAAIRDKKELARALGETLRADVDALNNTNYHTENIFGLWVAPGFHDSDHYLPYLMQGGIQLPDREYYLGDSEHMKNVRAKYETHVAAMMKLAGFSDPETRARQIIELEHSIAQTHLTLAENEDIHKADNIWKRADFSRRLRALIGKNISAARALNQIESFDVWQPEAFTGEAALVHRPLSRPGKTGWPST